MSKPAALTQTELLTLVAIARREDDAYGVTIADEIKECNGRSVSLAAVYAALDRLERYRLVRPWFSEPIPSRGGRSRRHYSLTADGIAVLDRERANALRMWRSLTLGAKGNR